MIIRVIDLETGGFALPHGCCEAAWTEIAYVNDHWMITDARRTFLNPEYPMNSEAIRTHGITHEMCNTAPSTKFVSKFMQWNGKPGPFVAQNVNFMVAHNARFEWQWVDPDPARKICSLLCARKIFPGQASYANEKLFDSLGLREKAIASGLPLSPMHRAQPDTVVTAFILLKMLETYSPEQLADITGGKSVGDRINFGKHVGMKWDDKDVPDHYLKWIVNDSNMNVGIKAQAREECDRRGIKL